VTIVLKFGGSSVADIPRIQKVAEIIVESYVKKGTRVVVVVSAMAGVTNQMHEYLSKMGTMDVFSEDDVVLSSGEPITTALLARSLLQSGYSAQSFLGWQLPIVTNSYPRNARILNICVGHLHTCFDQGKIPVVAGFQGMTEMSRITTLGRGGSDATAVALAVALQAERCDIYTDVDGVYTADPRFVPAARKLKTLSYEEMLELSLCGAKVLQARSVELALRYQVPVHVLSSFTCQEGTTILKKEQSMETFVISGITSQADIIRVTLSFSGPSSSLFPDLLPLSGPLDWFYQKTMGSASNIVFLSDAQNWEPLNHLLTSFEQQKRISSFLIERDLAKISVVGLGIATRAEVLSAIYKSCEADNIPILGVQTTPMRFSFVTTRPHVETAVVGLHRLCEMYIPTP
jgi:aspartate kinase